MKIALLMPNNANWRGGARAEIYESFLREIGHEVQTIFLRRDEFPSGLDGFDIVFNHAMQAPPAKLRNFASSRGRTTVVHVNHSSIGHLDQQETIKTTLNSKRKRLPGKLKEQGEMTRKLCDILYAARDIENIWYASVDFPHIAHAAGVKRTVQLPTPMPELKEREWRPASSLPVVAIIGRDDPIKNRLNQYIAVAGMKDRITIHFVAEKTELMLNTMKAMGVNLNDKNCRHKHIPTMPHRTWKEYLAKTPDIILQCSYSESFNNVACEAMQVGIPVVASEAIKISDEAYRADPNNPKSIESAIDRALSNYKNACEDAVKIGSGVARKCREMYRDAIDHIKEHSTTFYPRHLPNVNTKKSGSRCIVVIAGDEESKETLDLTKKTIKNYANKTKSEIVEIDDQPIEGYRIGNKWLCKDLAKSFSQVLYLDCDVLIQENSPNIFNVVPKGKFAVYNELEHLDPIKTKLRIAELAASTGVNMSEPEIALNAGVMLFDSDCSWMYSQPEVPVRKSHTLDQDLLTVKISQNLGTWEKMNEKFNWIFFRKDFWDGVKDSWFIHLAGARPHNYRCELLHRFNAGNFSPLKPIHRHKCNPPWADLIK